MFPETVPEMDTQASSSMVAEERQHKRSTSSVIKSMMAPRNHRRNLSAGEALTQDSAEDENSNGHHNARKPLPLLPPNHPHSEHAILGELHHNRDRTRSSPKKSNEPKESVAASKGHSLHKKTLSSISLKTLAKEKEKGGKSKERSRDEAKSTQKRPNRSKSQSSLSALLSRPKSSKGQHQDSREVRDKENQTPQTPSAAVPPPIWAQFASQPFAETTRTSSIPLNDVKDVDAEVALYTPKAYSPSKQRNFHGMEQPTLTKRGEPKSRPKSAYLPSSTSTNSLAESFAGLRRTSNSRMHPSVSSRSSSGRQRKSSAPHGERAHGERTPGEVQAPSRRSSGASQMLASVPSKEPLTIAKRGARVMAAVAALNGKSKEAQKETPKEVKADRKAIEREFESVLDSRNVPQNMRDKLRSLDVRIKADFVKQDKSDSPTKSAAGSLKADFEKQDKSESPTKSAAGSMKAFWDAPMTTGVHSGDACPAEQASPTKRSRPRSKTFTLSRGDNSPTKKQKSENDGTAGRTKSTDFSKSGSSKSLTSAGVAQAMAFVGKPAKPTVPGDFISYLRKEQQPENVEVGKLHKLRLLLRNETVTWVDAFIKQGGMMEVVGLLHRIMDVEWREEHEDALLHEVLLCLKALCTTDLALQRLAEIESSLFPALLKMLFDEERKGPSEFTTRGIIISLLFTHLSTASETEVAPRAQTLLSYLRDPSPPEDAQPLGFITSMHVSRPYRVWCKEIVNVTKEVFWIFLHNLNTIPVPPTTALSETHSYHRLHFPKERPPVPAAPYVGGVEWDATNYLATHLDLVNGIIASLPTTADRNILREDLKLSGYEKCLGGTLRTCKEKFYGAVHDALRTWVAAAVDDGWDVRDVRMGPKLEEKVKSRPASPTKKAEKPPQIEAPAITALPSLGLGGGRNERSDVVDAWE
ncbi:MAG: hypothetical protein M1819_005585 [Sarea resinae]|nr:MAG: hypothetical protein M1819_005585 [Sarea resinae]